jgi:hypothetical protein
MVLKMHGMDGIKKNVMCAVELTNTGVLDASVRLVCYFVCMCFQFNLRVLVY